MSRTHARHRSVIVAALAVLMLVGTVVPAQAHGKKVQVHTIRDFTSVVATAIDETEEFGVDLMEMQCRWLVRTEFPNGTAREVQSCRVTTPLTEGAAPPAHGVFVDSEPCVWFSDYHLTTDGTDWIATWYRSLAFPNGKVIVTSVYGPDPIPPGCEDSV